LPGLARPHYLTLRFDVGHPAIMPSMTLGAWTAHTIETGSLRLDGGSMFGSVPKTLWSRTHPADERNRILLAMRCLLLEGHGRRVLVDVGIGDKLEPKWVDIYDVRSDTHSLDRSLAALGLGAEDVTDVVLTHLHFDHAGGSTRVQAGTLVPKFPRAVYHLQRRNWDNAMKPNPRERASYLPENFEPLMTAGVLRFWDGPQAPWPGVEMLTAEGHTRGQQLVRVAGGGAVLYFVADLIPTRSHVRIPFVMGYDMAAIETMAEKRQLLERAALERAWVCLEHDPEVAWAMPRADGEDFAWETTVAADDGRVERGAPKAHA
jgi:glyoxylase-like metal-dependent hydrolase (beta-lactamase superfamily II)